MSRRTSDSRSSFQYKLAKLYQEKQEAAELRGQAKRNLAYQAHPELLEADRKVRLSGSRLLEVSFGGPDTEKAIDAREVHEAAKQNRYELLSDLGYDLYFDEPDFDCRVCNDTGLFEGERCTACFAQSVYPILLEDSGLEQYKKHKFEYFRLELFNREKDPREKADFPSPYELQIRVRQMMEDYVDQFVPGDVPGYFFFGKPGTGKTFLAICVGHALLERGYRVFFTGFGEMIQQIKEYRTLTGMFTPDPLRLEQAERFMEKLYESDFLILDDLGSGIGDIGMQNAELIALLNSRLSQGKPMFVTANLDTKQIAKLYDERVLSRLLGSFKVIRFYGQDVRTKLQRL